jgi:hypothetical protein
MRLRADSLRLALDCVRERLQCEGKLAALHSRLIPILAIIARRILAPDALRVLDARLRQIFRRAAPRPIRPTFDVAVPHRILMDVVQRRPSNADQNASRARPRERKVFARVSFPHRSKRAMCGHVAIPIHAAAALCPALPQARDNDWATHTTQTFGGSVLRKPLAARE